MRGRYILILLLSVFLLPLLAKAQDPFATASLTKKKDSSKVSIYKKEDYLKVRSAKGYTLGSSVNMRYGVLDTGLVGFQRSNTAFNPYDPQRYLGIMISPHQPLIFDPFTKSTMRVGFDALRNTLISEDDINYFKAGKRYTNIFYHFGRYHEQYIDVLHTQNVTKGFNFGFQLRRQAGDGEMYRQLAYNSNFNAFGSYTAKNQRYGNYFSLGMSYLEMDANGGLYSDQLFESSGRISTTLPVNLNDAGIHYNEKFASITQYVNFGRHYKNNPADTDEVVKFKPVFRILHTFSYSRRGFSYTDDSVSTEHFYKNRPNINDSLTFDTTAYSSMLNRVAVSTIIDEDAYEKGQRQNYLVAGINFEHLRYMQQYKVSNFDNVFLDAAVKTLSKDGQSIDLQGSWNITGPYANNYKAIASLYRPLFNSRVWIAATAERQKISQELILLQYSANNFAWTNNFSPSEYSKAGLNMVYVPAKIRLSASYTDLYRQVYINENAVPVQNNAHAGLLQINLDKSFSLGKFKLDNVITYQYLGGPDVLRLPRLITYQSFYFTHRFRGKNKNLALQLGVDCYFRSGYYGDAYMPATTLFYRQNTKKLGDIPVIDPFISTQIKTARIFVKYEYANKGIGSKAYYEVPHYPITTGVIRVGISWSFFD